MQEPVKQMKKCFFVILMVFLCTSVYSDEGDPAILSKGPVPVEGIEFLGVNVIPASYGKYIFSGDYIDVYYTTSEIFLSGRWIDSDCRLVGVKRLSTRSDRVVLSYTDTRGWTVFLSFETDADYICNFFEIYISRQNYFLLINRDASLFSFPAILEVK